MSKGWFKDFVKGTGVTQPPKTDVRLKPAVKIIKGRKKQIDDAVKKATGN